MSWTTPVAAITALLIAGLLAVLTGDQPHLAARLLLAVGLVLVSRDVIDGVAAGLARRRGLARLGDPRFWLFLWLQAANFAALFSLFTWSGEGLDLRVVALGAGIGIFVALAEQIMPHGAGHDTRFDLTNPADASLLGRVVTYGWPFGATALVVAAILDPPDGGWSGVYPLFQLIFLPFLITLFPLRRGWRDGWADHAPRVAGYGLLVAGFFSA